MADDPDANRVLAMKIDLPPDELRRHVATLIAIGLQKAMLPYVRTEKIKAADLEGTANFVLGGLLGLAAKSSANH